MTMRILTAAGAAALLLGACATNQKVATNQLGDDRLTCEQIRTEDKKLNEILEKARNNKGVSTANVAAVLLFWPAAVGNYMDADKAEELVEKRKSVLSDLYKSKNCESAD
jgi:type IV pilus biogenesis protein CpaD/CtpE